MDHNSALYFRDLLREARAKAFRDAEAFHEILYAVENLGSCLLGEIENLWKYRVSITNLAENSPLATDIPKEWREWHLPFADLYDLVKDARNDALHQGAYARHLTSHAIELALVLEDALMSDATTASDFMVRDPVQAYPWQPLSIVRQQMLLNSFSSLPIWLEDDSQGWYLISDQSLARYLRSAPSKGKRKQRLAKTVGDAISERVIEPEKAEVCMPKDPISKVLKTFRGRPILVVLPQKKHRLLGILTAFDLL